MGADSDIEGLRRKSQKMDDLNAQLTAAIERENGYWEYGKHKKRR